MKKNTRNTYPTYDPSEGELPAFDPVEKSLGNFMPGEPEALDDPQSEMARQLIDALSDDALFKLCGQRICAMCPEQKTAEDQRLRALADLDNARKRLAREKEEQVKFAAEAVLADIVPCIDNLNLALQHSAHNTACKDLAAGVEMTKKLLLDSLKQHGLEPVGAVGDPFDPAVHEAVGVDRFEHIADNHIGALLNCGYMLHQRLLRPARVIVCKNT